MFDQVIAKREQAGANIQMAKDLVATADDKKRDLTAAESKKIDELLAQADALRSQADKLERIENLESGITAGPVPAAADVFGRHAGSLRAYKGRAKEAYDVGQWLQATLCGNEKSQRYCDMNNIRAAGGENVGTAGGFLVPEAMERAIIDLRDAYGVARRFGRIVNMGTDSVTIPMRADHVTSYFINENTSVTESQASWSQVTLTARKQAVLSRWSSELDEDALISMADWLTQDIAWSFAKMEDDCLLLGDGTDNYGGMYGINVKIIDGNHAAGAVDAATVGHNTFAEIDATDLSTAMAALPGYAIPNAAWICSSACYALVFERLSAAGGGNTLASLAEGARPAYLGHPIIISETMPSSTGDLENAVMLLFGDLRQAAVMGSRREIRIMVSRERYMDSDQIGILGTSRFHTQVHSLGDGTTAGPIVALVGA